MKFVYLMMGGALGTTARYALSAVVHRLAGTGFPYGTLLVNLLGCFILGFFVTIFEKKFTLSTNMVLLATTGFCGAFTTFSTFMLETSYLLKDGELMRALGNVLLSVIVGLLVFRLGLLLGEVF